MPATLVAQSGPPPALRGEDERLRPGRRPRAPVAADRTNLADARAPVHAVGPGVARHLSGRRVRRRRGAPADVRRRESAARPGRARALADAHGSTTASSTRACARTAARSSCSRRRSTRAGPRPSTAHRRSRRCWRRASSASTVPAGEHVVEFRYEPYPHYPLLLALGALTLLALALLPHREGLRRRLASAAPRRSPAPAESEPQRSSRAR